MGPETTITARMLLESSELHEATTDAMMTVGHKTCLPADRELVRAFVAAGFKNVSTSMKEHSEEQLESLTLTRGQAKEVLLLVRSLGNLKLRSLGRAGSRNVTTSNDTDSMYRYDSYTKNGHKGTGDLGS